VNTPRVLVVDDNLVVRSGLVSLLESEGIEVVGEAGDGQSALGLAARLKPDLVLLDVQMPLLDGVAAAELLSRTTRVIMLTYTDDSSVIRAAIGNGAAGYLVHGSFTAKELTDAVHQAVAGSHPLSPVAVSALVGAVRQERQPEGPGEQSPLEPERNDTQVGSVGRFGLSSREVDVMRLIVQGRSNTEIAGELFLAEKTIKNHVNHIYAKLAVASRAAAIARWLGTAAGDGR
jgi:DNA-binding NarL/FixJ family response regulator